MLLRARYQAGVAYFSPWVCNDFMEAYLPDGISKLHVWHGDAWVIIFPGSPPRKVRFGEIVYLKLQEVITGENFPVQEEQLASGFTPPSLKRERLWETAIIEPELELEGKRRKTMRQSSIINISDDDELPATPSPSPKKKRFEKKSVFITHAAYKALSADTIPVNLCRWPFKRYPGHSCIRLRWPRDSTPWVG